MQQDHAIKTILYVPTQTNGSVRFFSWSDFPPIWYFRIQKEILKLLKNKRNTSVFIKYYPSRKWSNPNTAWVKANVLDLHIVQENLSEVLKEKHFDLIVTEGFATTLLEVLCTRSQILAFIPSDFIKFHKEAKTLLNKRVFLAETETEYCTLLTQLMNLSDSSSFKEINDEFLFKFGIGDPQADPLTLSRDAIQSIIS